MKPFGPGGCLCYPDFLVIARIGQQQSNHITEKKKNPLISDL